MVRKGMKIETKIRILGKGKDQNGFSFKNAYLPLRLFQTEEITERTCLLYFVYRDKRGFHSGWAWSEKREDLLSFLFNNLLCRSLSLEMGLRMDYEHGLERAFDEYLLTLPLPEDEKGPLPKELLSLLGSIALLLAENASTASSYNESSVPLQNHFSSFFYSASWVWIDGAKGAKRELGTHVLKERLEAYPLRILLRSDKTL